MEKCKCEHWQVCPKCEKSRFGTAIDTLRNGTAMNDPILMPRSLTEEQQQLCSLKSITDGEVEKVVRAFWRRIYHYRNNYDIELPTPLPVEFMAHMATALKFVDKDQTTTNSHGGT